MPLTVLKIEIIGNPRLGFQPAWVRHLTDIGPGRLIWEYMHGQADYSQANSVGSRGVYKYFFLKETELYQVAAPQSFRRTKHYFCRVMHGQIEEISMEEVIACLVKRRSEKMFTLRR